MKEVATVIDSSGNVQINDGQHLIVGQKLYSEESVKGYDDLLTACQAAYRKHHMGDDLIGWSELSDILYVALCSVMGDEGFDVWVGGCIADQRDNQK